MASKTQWALGIGCLLLVILGLGLGLGLGLSGGDDESETTTTKAATTTSSVNPEPTTTGSSPTDSPTTAENPTTTTGSSPTTTGPVTTAPIPEPQVTDVSCLPECNTDAGCPADPANACAARGCDWDGSMCHYGSSFSNYQVEELGENPEDESGISNDIYTPTM